jgi:hypothetical protein
LTQGAIRDSLFRPITVPKLTEGFRIRSHEGPD